MKYFVYILLCNQKTFYVGITKDIDKRFEDHKNKKSFFTKKFSDIKLVYSEEYSERKTAEKRETQLKGWSNAKKKALIIRDIDQLEQLSKAVSSSTLSSLPKGLAKPSGG